MYILQERVLVINDVFAYLFDVLLPLPSLRPPVRVRFHPFRSLRNDEKLCGIDHFCDCRALSSQFYSITMGGTMDVACAKRTQQLIYE